ncbi:hypothetical protein LX66_0407 [Chitinophaga japonensis]|uniref:DUF5018 domain-containing protein n=2 Tax=Chitinophaga japonensis TaxID=104662 RepID=A0A562TD96_CHIJA|nr:hypothetical protein LX66_0407 [Chitinophaga japonensis]
MSLLAACTKTETVAPPAERSNRILAYRVTNVAGDTILGVVNDPDSVIRVYLPYYYYLTSLVPDIQVSAGATVTPASGTLVENLLDVFDNGRDIRYTVTGQDGSKATYRLLIEVQQPDFTVDELTTDPASPAEYVNNDIGDVPVYLSWYGDVSSGNQELDRQLIRVTLTGEEGNAYVVDNNAGFKLSSGPSYVFFYLPPNSAASLPTGLYHISIRFYSKTVTLQNPVRIVQP